MTHGGRYHLQDNIINGIEHSDVAITDPIADPITGPLVCGELQSRLKISCNNGDDTQVPYCISSKGRYNLLLSRKFIDCQSDNPFFTNSELQLEGISKMNTFTLTKISIFRQDDEITDLPKHPDICKLPCV